MAVRGRLWRQRSVGTGGRRGFGSVEGHDGPAPGHPGLTPAKPWPGLAPGDLVEGERGAVYEVERVGPAAGEPPRP